MSCGCNSNPCNCLPSPSTCCTPTTESVEYTFENGNTAGVGVFDNDTDNLVQFRGIVSESVALTVTLNATDNTIVLDFDDAQLVAAIPDATTTQRGILETSTNAEALAKAATDKILTPSNLAALGSTTTFAGLVELATDAETITGTSTTLAVTPAGLAAAGALTGTTTFADAVARAAAVPNFKGQFGVQLDTVIPYIATGTSAGNWTALVRADSISSFWVTALATTPAADKVLATNGAGVFTTFDITLGGQNLLNFPTPAQEGMISIDASAGTTSRTAADTAEFIGLGDPGITGTQTPVNSVTTVNGIITGIS